MKNKCIFYNIFFVFVILNKLSFGQIIYQHGFDAGITGTSIYTVAPITIDANLNSSFWSTAPTTFTSFAGTTATALSISNSGGTPTYSLTYNVVSGFNCDITAFSFWSKRSNTGAQNWTLTVNGATTIGAGTTPTAGISTGVLAVSNAANGLSGTVNVVLQLGGASSTGSFRLDDFTLYGNVYPVSTCTAPTIQSSLFSSSSITNSSATINWTSGNGGNVLVMVHQGALVNSTPNSGSVYTANSTYGLGQQIGIGNYVVYDGIGNSVNVTGLTSGMDYYFSVFEYNTTSGSPCYLIPSLTGSLTTTGSPPSCFEIESILADACDNTSPCPSSSQEGENEMVRFKVGSVALNVNDLSIVWASANGYLGIETNTTITSSKINAINSTITGCGFVKQAIGGTILPAGSTVLLVTSTDMCIYGNSFSNLSDTIYVIFQKAGNTNGHFLNYSSSTAIRTLSMSFSSPASCSDVVNYDAHLLINKFGTYGGTSSEKDGGAIDFTPSGIATYVNLGCQAPISSFSINIGASTQTVCFNSSQTFSATIVGSNTSVLWSLGATATGTFSSVNTLATTYTPSLSDNGTIKLYCTAFKVCASQTITVKDSLLLTILQLPIATINASNGYSLCPAVTSVLSYSITNPTFVSVVSPSWSLPSGSGTTYTVSSPSSATPVTYSLNLTNVCGTTLETFTVYSLESPTVTLSATTPTACVGSTVSLTATGNTNNFSWNNPLSANSTVTLTANTTTIGIVTSTNSCGTSSDTYTLTVTQNPTITVDNPNPTLCAGQSATITATSSTGTYTWQPDAVNTNSIVVNSASTHTVFTDNVCNSASVAVNVVLNATPVLTISASSNSLCAGGLTTATLSLVGSTGTYSWSTGATTSTISITTPGVYTATVDAGLCGVKDASISIDILITPTISVVPTSTLLCDGATATLTASSNLTNFSWSNGATNTLTIAVTANNLYTVSVSNECGAPTASVNILTDVTPTLNVVTNTPTLCPSQSATLTVTGGSVGPYTWSNSASTSSMVTTNGGTVSVSNSNSCGTDTKSISVSIIPNPTVTLTSNSYTVCPGDVINIVANSTEGNYSWSGSANTTATLALIASSSTTGTVTTTNFCNIDGIDTYTINVTPKPTLTVDLTNVSLCTGQSATVTANSSTGSYTWMPGGSNSNTLSVSATGDYTVYTNNACVMDSLVVSVSINSTPTLTISSTSSSICLTGQTATLSTAGSTGTYNWSDGSSLSSLVVNTPGVYSATVTTSSCGSAIKSFTIDATPTPTITLSSSSTLLCDGVTATLTAPSNMSNYSWSDGSTNTNSIVVNTAGIYTVGVSNACGSATDSVKIQTNTTPTLNLTASSTTLCPNQTATLAVTGGSSPYIWSNSSNTGSVVTTTGGLVSVTYSNVCGIDTQTVTVITSSVTADISANPVSGITPLIVNFSNNSVGANSYTWTLGNGNTAGTQTIAAQTYTTVGNFMAFLIATDGTCFDTDSVLIHVLNEAPTLIIPNVFTPNSDSVNDIFRVTGTNIIDFNCTIFDRWGLQMFYWDNIKSGWDGKSDGKEVPAGTYFYIINAKDIDGIEIKKQGYLSLFR